MAKGYCVECESALSLGNDPYKGQRVTCYKCGATLEVIGLSPIELDWVYDEDSDDFEDYDSGDYDSDLDYDYDYESSSQEY
jgi:lysine biosynthesis protein LysW